MNPINSVEVHQNHISQLERKSDEYGLGTFLRFRCLTIWHTVFPDEDKYSGKNVSQRLETFAEAKTCIKSYLQGRFH